MAALNGLAWSVVIGPALFASLLVAILNNITAGPPHIAATYETRPEFWACPLVVLATPLVVAVFIRRQDRITGRGLVVGTGLAILLHVMLFGCLAARNGGGGGGGPPPQLELIE